MILDKVKKCLGKLSIVALVPILFFSPSIVRADELSDLNAKIQEAKNKQAYTMNKIKQIDILIRDLSSTGRSLSQQLNSLQVHKKELEQQIAILNEQISVQDENIFEFEKKLMESQDKINSKINYLYKLSFMRPHLIFSDGNDLKSFFHEQAELNFTIDLYAVEIKDYYNKIELAKRIKQQSIEDKQAADSAMQNLNKQIERIQAQIVKNQNALAQASQSKADLVAQSNELASQLHFLSKRQQELLAAEIAQMNASPQVGQKPLQPGQYYFMGRGRDLVEGHGLGMSQWGAYGMAKQGWTYDQILKFYYTGVTIGDYVEPQQIRVENKEHLYPPAARERGFLTIDEYLAGIGEVPNSWPPEAIKAQIVAARTYLMNHCGNQSICTICGDAKCQVYNGVTSADPTGLGKLRFVQETKGKVILYNGVPITAYYSASHRGCSSTISTVWGENDLPYIQSVRDDPYAYKDYWTYSPYNGSDRIYPYNWKWRTNGYTLEQLKEIFSRSPELDVGDIRSIDLKKDGCGRVAKVIISGSRGQKSLTGWNFRASFNQNTPYNDYLYSTEFGFYQYQN